MKITPSFSNNINGKLSHEEKKLEIFHLGGIANPTFNPKNTGRTLDCKKYFYERVSVITKNGTVHLYGNKLKKYVTEWMKEVRKGETEENFQTWMQRKTQNVEFEKFIMEHSVRYFDDTDRKLTEVHVDKKGFLVQHGINSKGDKLKALANNTYAFVLGEVFNPKTEKTETKLYATPKTKTEKGKIQHSSFLGGATVKSAGMLVVSNEGQVVNIRNQSGHYKPSSKEMAYLVKHLKESKYDISKIRVTYYKNELFRIINSIFNRINININVGMIKQNAQKWFENTGKSLISQTA